MNPYLELTESHTNKYLCVNGERMEVTHEYKYKGRVKLTWGANIGVIYRKGLQELYFEWTDRYRFSSIV